MTISAFLPPHSSETRLPVRPHSAATCLPVSVEPVMEISAIPGLLHIASPTTEPRPCTRLMTPGGSPASASARTNS